jgi:hypothetical protein
MEQHRARDVDAPRAVVQLMEATPQESHAMRRAMPGVDGELQHHEPTSVPPTMPSRVPSIHRCAASHAAGISSGATVPRAAISTRNAMPSHCQPRRGGKARAGKKCSVTASRA